MRQEYRYDVVRIGSKDSSILNEKDKELVGSYLDGIRSFNPNESRLDVSVSDVEGNVLEEYRDISDYTIRGVTQGPTNVNQLEVNPISYLEGRSFLGDVIVEYSAFNNLYSKGADLFIYDISSDRTEIQVKSLAISLRDLQYYTNKLQREFNDQSYFVEAFLEISNTGQKIPIINAITEVVGTETVATFKLYEPLPESVQIKDVCQVLESLGESSRFLISRKIVTIDDPVPELRGPNFAVEVGTSTISTDYSNYLELLSQKSWENSKGLYSAFKNSSLHTSINYEDFSDFIHFSSAVERLENARFKFEKIFEYQALIESSVSEAEKSKYQSEIDGLIENFDHYENYLYFESGSKAWPKKLDEETNCTLRPYENETDPRVYGDWYDQLFQEAEAYDDNNKDILTNTIPLAIREDLDNNEPYLIFIYMIGQHFDDLWVYARAISDRYKADNRLDFGISKELVKDALESFGINLYESNQNLNGLFELCQPDGTYDSGLEKYVDTFRSARSPYTRENSTDESGSVVTGSWEIDSAFPESGSEYQFNPAVDQPLLAENYRKEVYKRIYHNIPTLLKTRGTSRGLRVLLNCFGIPSDILKVKVQGGVDPEKRPFFGPEENITVSPEVSESLVISGSKDKVRILSQSAYITEYRNVGETGSFFSSKTLSEYVTVTSSNSRVTDDLHKVEVGFDLNEAVNRYFKENVGNFTVDDVIGDPRNREQQYGDSWKNLRETLLNNLDPVEEQFRTPAAIIRLVRYVDTTFFRMLHEFLPARAVADTGAIVKDNILHRNRWRGVEASWIDIIQSGSISGSTVYGSHGGAFEGSGERFETTQISGNYFNPVSTGDRWVDKPVISGSREFNGELAGTQVQVSDGELNPKNVNKKAGQPENSFNYNVWFLGLPDLPLCVSKVDKSESIANVIKFYVAGTSSVKTNLTGFTELTGSLNYCLYEPLGDTSIEQFEVASHRAGDTSSQKAVPSCSLGTVFMGWFLSGSEPNYGYPISPSPDFSIMRSVDSRSTHDKYQACYECFDPDYPLNRGLRYLWFDWNQAEHDMSQYHYYNKGDFIVAWKYLPSTVPPVPGPTSGYIWSDVGDIKLRFKSNTSQFADVVIPAESLFGTGEGYEWVGFKSGSLPTNFEIEEFVGVVECGNLNLSSGSYTGPFIRGDETKIDMQWVGSRNDNWYPRWYPIMDPSDSELINPDDPWIR